MIGYSAHQTLRLAVRDPERVGALVDAFSGAAATPSPSTASHWRCSDPGPLREQARMAAFADARAKALQYATLAGRELGKVSAISDVVPGGVQPRYELMAAKAGGMPVELGENTVTATVVVRWDWK